MSRSWWLAGCCRSTASLSQDVEAAYVLEPPKFEKQGRTGLSASRPWCPERNQLDVHVLNGDGITCRNCDAVILLPSEGAGFRTAIRSGRLEREQTPPVDFRGKSFQSVRYRNALVS